eukprot:GHVU01023395.1.p1 GENE.GHVU01023395.1~~GHVU01023395.1.p1  ORF type:complete len:164 (-),score=15.17 GHVU01023395.1:136-627(-)
MCAGVPDSGSGNRLSNAEKDKNNFVKSVMVDILRLCAAERKNATKLSQHRVWTVFVDYRAWGVLSPLIPVTLGPTNVPFLDVENAFVPNGRLPVWSHIDTSMQVMIVSEARTWGIDHTRDGFGFRPRYLIPQQRSLADNLKFVNTFTRCAVIDIPEGDANYVD